MTRRARAARRAWVLAWLSCGCAVDLWVGEPGGSGASDGTTAASSDGTTTAPPSADTDPSTTTGPEPGTSTGGTTLALDEGTSTTGPVAEEGTSTGPVAEGGSTTSVEIPCPGLGMLDCIDLPYCLWYGTPEAGECALSPCENPRHDCWGLGLTDCQSLFACAWVGMPEMGECAPIECVPCEILGADQCMETPTCVWSEGEMFCLPA